MLKKLGFDKLALSILLIMASVHAGQAAKTNTTEKTVKTNHQLNKFGDLKIQISESDIQQGDDRFLNAKIDVRKADTSLDTISFKHMQDMGYVAGLFIPKPQPLNDYFMIVKHGDYDGHLLLIDKAGKIINLGGGSFFLTDDKNYLFSLYEADSDGTGFSVYDLKNKQIAYKSDKDPRFANIDQWYKDDKGYFFTSDEDGKTKQIYVYDFAKKKLVSEPGKNRIKAAKKVSPNSVDNKVFAVLAQ